MNYCLLDEAWGDNFNIKDKNIKYNEQNSKSIPIVETFTNNKESENVIDFSKKDLDKNLYKINFENTIYYISDTQYNAISNIIKLNQYNTPCGNHTEHINNCKLCQEKNNLINSTGKINIIDNISLLINNNRDIIVLILILLFIILFIKLINNIT